MTNFNLRRRLADEGYSAEEIDEALSEEAERRNDDRRDRDLEESYKEKP